MQAVFDLHSQPVILVENTVTCIIAGRLLINFRVKVISIPLKTDFHYLIPICLNQKNCVQTVFPPTEIFG
jgi:hypothetical protein